MQRKETMQILEQYEASIERENKRLQQKLDATSKPEDRKAVEELIQKNNKRLQEQRSKTRNMVSYSHETGRAISREQAFETDRWVEDMSKGIVRDFHDFVRLVSVARDDNFNLSLWQDRLKKGENFVERRKKAIAEATQKLEKSKAEKSPETDVPQ
jgi:homoserine dehydrogenase